MQKIGLWGSLASIIGLGFAVYPFGADSDSRTAKDVQTHGDQSSGIGIGENKGDVDIETPAQEQHVIVSVNIDGRNLPFSSAVLQGAARKAREVQLPSQSHTSKLGLFEVKQLAKQFGLLDETPPNIHLRFLDGDIAYWYEQGLTEKGYKLEFAARRAVLDAARNQNLMIKDQGTLSWAAQQIMAELIKAGSN